MTYSYRVSVEAAHDILQAKKWYGEISEELQERFLAHLKFSYEVICLSPMGYQVRFGRKFRAYPMRHFPYLIFYAVKNSMVDIVAVFNTNMNPQDLMERLKRS